MQITKMNSRLAASPLPRSIATEILGEEGDRSDACGPKKPSYKANATAHNASIKINRKKFLPSIVYEPRVT